MTTTSTFAEGTPFYKYAKPLEQLPSDLQRVYTKSLERYPVLASCLSQDSDPNSFRWENFARLADLEVCLSHVHNSLADFETSVSWFEDQSFSVLTSSYQRSPGSFKTIRAQWIVPQSGPRQGAMTPLTGVRAWLRSRDSIGGLNIGLDFDPAGQVIDATTGHARK